MNIAAVLSDKVRGQTKKSFYEQTGVKKRNHHVEPFVKFWLESVTNILGGT